MKRYLYVLLLIMSALIVDVCAQTSPTYDDKTPPAFEWGNGKMNAQKQGTPTTGDQEIIANISVDTSKIEGYLNIPQGEGEEPVSIAQSVAEVNGKLDSITMDSYLDDGTITGSVIGQADITRLKPLKEVITSGSPIAAKTHRVFVEIRAAKTTDEFQIGFRNASNAMRPVKGRIMMEVNEAQDIYVYIPDEDNAPSALYITEGWR